MYYKYAITIRFNVVIYFQAINKTPKKKNQFVIPHIQSPAGPNVIRSPAFELSGTTTITLGDINYDEFTLTRVRINSLVMMEIYNANVRISRVHNIYLPFRFRRILLWKETCECVYRVNFQYR